MDAEGRALLELYRERVGRGLEALKSRIERAAAASGRPASAVELVAVSKFHPREAVEAALSLGIARFAENRVQEAEAKFEALRPARPGLRLDLIGHLQGNKVRKALGLFDRIQSLDSLELLEAILARLGAEPPSRPLELLLELHTAEDSKGGFAGEEELRRALELALAPGARSLIAPKGLMTMAPLTAEEASIRSSFARLRRLREDLEREFGLEDFGVLSMGMSGDFELAVEEGATEIRIGTALFGERGA